MGIHKSIIFEHLSQEDMALRVRGGDCQWVSFSAMEDITLPKNRIGILDKGAIDVYKHHASGKRVLINTLKPGHVFGIVDLFLKEDENHMQWHCKIPVTLLSLSGETLMQWLQEDSQLLSAYIAYVNGRIRFLNERIECFTHGCIEERVHEALKHPKLSQMSRSSLAEYLGISRASLYRVLKEKH